MGDGAGGLPSAPCAARLARAATNERGAPKGGTWSALRNERFRRALIL